MPFEKNPTTLVQIFHSAVQGDASIQSKLAVENYEEEDLLDDVFKESDRIWESVADEIRKYTIDTNGRHGDRYRAEHQKHQQCESASSVRGVDEIVKRIDVGERQQRIERRDLSA